MCVICVVKGAWLVYKWRNYCTLALTDCDIKYSTHFHLMTCTQDCALTLGDCETYLHLNCLLIVVNVVFIRIPILCRQIHDNYFSNNLSAGKIIFFWGWPLCADLPSFLQQRHTDICCSVWGSCDDILSSNICKDLPFRYLP